MPSQRDTVFTVNISSLTIAKVLMLAGALGFLYVIHDVVAILFVALILSSALTPFIKTMERFHVHRIIGVALIFTSFLAVLTLAVVLLIPPLSLEYTRFVQKLPFYIDQVIEMLHGISPDVNILEQAKSAFESIQSNALQFAGGVVVKFFDLISGIFAIFLIFVVVFYMIVEEKALRNAIHFFTPQSYRDYVDHLITKVQDRVGMWLRGQVALSLIIFSLDFVVLLVLGVDYALLLAIIGGLTEFMPVIGPIVAAVPAVFVAFNQSPMLALWTLLAYWLIQYIENHFLVPRVMQKAVGLNPLGSIVALLIGAKIGGLFGILLAIPVATMITTVGSELLGARKKEEEGE
ncbi:MAG: AI-2E family transporter [Patescibacteria group bacterium]